MSNPSKKQQAMMMYDHGDSVDGRWHLCRNLVRVEHRDGAMNHFAANIPWITMEKETLEREYKVFNYIGATTVHDGIVCTLSGNHLWVPTQFLTVDF